MRRAKKNGAKFGNPVNLSEAREKGVLENIRRADEFSATIARVIPVPGGGNINGEWHSYGAQCTWTPFSLREAVDEGKHPEHAEANRKA